MNQPSTPLLSRIQSSLHHSLSTSPTPLPLSPQTLSNLLSHTKQLLSTIQILKLQRKSYTTIIQNNKAIQIKLNNYNTTVQSIQSSYNERMKVVVEENKMLKEQIQKQKKYYQEKYQNVDKEIQGLRQEKGRLEDEMERLKREIGEYQKRVSRDAITIQERQAAILTLTTINSFSPLPPPTSSHLLSLFTSNLNTLLVSFLTPRDLKCLLLTNRILRQSILRSTPSILQIFRTINITNKRRNKFLQKHVKHFDISCQKISQDIIQIVFYKYMILKKDVGAYMKGILNDCALLFQGKFVEQMEVLPVIDDGVEEMEEYQDFPVDRDVKDMYKEELVMENKMLAEEIYVLFQKIQNSSQLYNADVENKQLFLTNLQNNYSKLFVFSKKLCTESKHLQMLNNYLIKMLIDRQHFQITKNNQIQDLKAQLQSQSKIKNFFSVKSINSEQRCLTLENEKLNLQMRLKDLSQRYYDLEQMKKKWEEDNKELNGKNQILIKDNKLFKQNFDQVHVKYTKIMQELEVLRNNLQKMNLSEH